MVASVIGHGTATVFRPASNSTRAEPDLGIFVRHKKAWNWRHLGHNVWDRFDGHKRPTRNPTDLPTRSLFSLFDTRNARDAALRLVPLTVKDSQLVVSPDNLTIRPISDPRLKPTSRIA
ncbi:hypothetical protein GSI_07298 [Ganoderma sinense ZZ0214-1]|uniref:Uncharacterized protein n=1 Tax=Ganoderma sinense ZZ0214-1 TaxID=1077348 RepID=A0A2G8SA28_9APHY|nr:hypothetical protein GSI_07298 [Ganoderma sinense ZZ0214-1]